MSHPKVSVCIANYNGEHVLRDCLSSVISQEYDNLEIIVHDDCSTDGSLQLLTNYSEQITVISSDKNVGYCESNNRMMNQANGEYILLLNNDTALSDGALDALLNSIQQDDWSILTLKQVDFTTGEVIDNGCKLDLWLTPLGIKSTLDSISEVDFVHGACMFFHKTIAESFDYFPQTLESIAEDLYFCLRARSLNMKIGCLSSHYYLHHSGYSFGGGAPKNNHLKTTLRRRYLSERNRLAMTINFYPLLLKPLLIINLASLLFEALIFSIIRQGGRKIFRMYYQAIVDGFKLSFDHKWQLTYQQILSLCWIPHKFKLVIRHGLPTFDK